MEGLYPRCAGIDAHKETPVVCVLTPGVFLKRATKRVASRETTRAVLRLPIPWRVAIPNEFPG